MMGVSPHQLGGGQASIIPLGFLKGESSFSWFRADYTKLESMFTYSTLQSPLKNICEKRILNGYFVHQSYNRKGHKR